MKRIRKAIMSQVLCLIMAVALFPTMAKKARALEVDETNYTVSTENDLRDALAAINTAEAGVYSITLGADIVVGDGIQSNQLKLEKNTVTIYGEGHTIYMVKACLMVVGNATLNLGAEDYTKSLTITDKAPTTGNACEPLITANNASLTMYDGVTLSGRNGVDTAGGVQLEKAVFHMYGGTINGCKSDSIAGGVLAYNQSQFFMSGGTIENCNSQNNGGGVYVYNSSFEMSGGEILDCNSVKSGGGVYVFNSSFEMSGGEILDCYSVNYGGGVYTNSGFKMSGGSIKRCTNSTYGGGGICVRIPAGSDSAWKFIMEGGEIVDCKGTSENGYGLGGGILIISGSAEIQGGAKVYDNHAVKAGDDVFSFGNNATLKLAGISEGMVLSETNGSIDGWYVDGVVEGEDTVRWNEDGFLQKYTPSQDVINKQIALKAAHGMLKVTLTAESNTLTYDGTEQSVSGYTCSEEGVTFADTVKASGSGTKAGDYAVTFSGVVLNETTDLEDKYIVSNTVDGVLTIKKRTVTVTGESGSKVYDGTALTKNSASCEGLAEGDKLSEITMSGSITNVGSTENAPSDAKILNASGEDVTNCYEITYKSGTLSVEKAPAPENLSASEKPSVSAENLIENGADQVLIIAPEKLPEGYTTIEYSIDGGETWATKIPTGKEVGEYPIQVRYIADGNHTDFVGETLTATIKEKPAASGTTDAKEELDPAAPTGDATGPLYGVTVMAALALAWVLGRRMKL